MKGRIGLGTNNPVAKLHINGNGLANIASGTWSQIWWARTNGHFFATAAGNNYEMSIVATHHIGTHKAFISAQGSFTHSDSRIKRDIKEVDDDEALVKLRQIEPKTYGYKDVVVRGDDTVIGFIADEVETVCPEAVKKTTATIPNILEMSNVAHSNIITFTNFNTSNLSSNTSTLECVDVRSGDEQFITIVEVIDDKTIQVKEDLSDWLGSIDETGNLVVDTTTSTLTPEEYEALEPDEQNKYAKTDEVYEKTITSYPGDNLYIRGERVNDFRTLKKEMLFAINFSATQELDRQLQAEKDKVASLEARIFALENN